MKIKKLELTDGYKRFHHLTIDLGEAPARIIALVGPNGCGKSSVLDGMLFHNASQQRIGNKSDKGNRYHSMDETKNYDAQRISITFDGGTFEQARKQREAKGKRNTVFSFRSCYRHNNQVRISESRATTVIAENNYGASTAADLDDKMEDNYRRLHGKFQRYFKNNSVTYAQAASIIIGELNASLKQCLDLQIEDLGNIEDDKGTLYFFKSDHPKPFEFNVLSAGEKEAVDLLLDLYLRKEDYDDTVFLIDEPELHLNTAIQRKLLVEINKLISAKCQLWIATHSMGFLRALQVDLKDQCQVVYFQPGTPYAAKPVTLKPIKPSVQVWRAIFDTALDDLAGLISPKRIIYCEGRAEPGAGGTEKGLDANVFNAIFATNYPETQFVSSGGQTEPDQRSAIAIAILSKIFSSVEIWVLKDRDFKSGQPTTQADRDEYLKKNKLHRLLKRWEIENYLYDSEVLEAYCHANNLQFDVAAYSTLVKNMYDDKIKEQTGKIKTICGITSSLNSETFKRQLAATITPQMRVYKELNDCIFPPT